MWLTVLCYDWWAAIFNKWPPWILLFSSEQQSLFRNKLYACCIITFESAKYIVVVPKPWSCERSLLNAGAWGDTEKRNKTYQSHRLTLNPCLVSAILCRQYLSLRFNSSSTHMSFKKMKINKQEITPDWLTITHVAQWSFPVNFSANACKNTHPIWNTKIYRKIFFLHGHIICITKGLEIFSNLLLKSHSSLQLHPGWISSQRETWNRDNN